MYKKIILLYFFLCSSLYADGINLKANFQTFTGIFIPPSENTDFSNSGFDVDGSISAIYNSSLLYVNGHINYDKIYGNEIEARIKEAYLSYKKNFFQLKMGRQTHSWGVSDGIEITDILCPKDYTKLISGNYTDSRLSIDAILLKLYSPTTSLDLYFIPIFTKPYLPLDYSNPIRDCLFPELKSFSYVPISLLINDNIEYSISNSEYGLKFSNKSFIDTSLYFFYGYDDLPVYDTLYKTIDLDNEIKLSYIQLNYHRVMMMGFDTSIPIKDFLIRLEGAYFPNRYINYEGAIQENKNLLGIDYINSNITLTSQYFNDIIIGDITRDENHYYSHGVTLDIAKDFYSINLKVDLKGILNINDLDSVIQGEIKYNISDNLNFITTLTIFNWGFNKGSYGQYQDLSNIKLTMTYSL